jgi:hypothetical protein
MMDEHVEPAPESPANRVEESTPIERRMVMRVMRHWRAQAETRELPRPVDMTFDGDPDIPPASWIARLAGSGPPTIEFLGANFVAECGAGLIGAPLTEVPPATLLGGACRYYADVIRRRVPISIGGTLAHRDGRTLVYRSIIVPLAEDGASLTHLLGAANFRVAT